MTTTLAHHRITVEVITRFGIEGRAIVPTPLMTRPAAERHARREARILFEEDYPTAVGVTYRVA